MATIQSQALRGAEQIGGQHPVIRSQFTGEVKEADPASQTLTLTVSTEDEDRDGDMILASGWDLKAYKKNPVVLFAHRYDMPAVGKASKIWVEDAQLKATIQFAPTSFGQELWALYAGGFMRAASVGFMPLEEPSERTPKRPNPMWRSFLYRSQELLEFSLVPVPANSNALVQALDAGLSMRMVEKALAGALPEMMIPVDNKSADLVPTLKGPIAYASAHPDGTPKADEDEAWDAGAEVLGLKPYANEHACRLYDPDAFQDDSFRRMGRESDGKPYDVIMGKLTGETTMTEQSYRYPISDWTVGEARKHCKAHEGILFEPAKAVPPKNLLRSRDLGDDLDYLRVLLDGDEPFPSPLLPVAKELMESLMRVTGYDSAVEDKSGAVLSRKNKDDLTQAQALIQRVLDSASPQQEEGLDPERIAALVGLAFIKKLGG